MALWIIAGGRIYLAIGAVIALAFAFWGPRRMGVKTSFLARVLTAPGVVLLWPIVLMTGLRDFNADRGEGS